MWIEPNYKGSWKKAKIMALPGIISENRHATDACGMKISSQNSSVLCCVFCFSISTQEAAKGQAAVHGSKETLLLQQSTFLS